MCAGSCSYIQRDFTYDKSILQHSKTRVDSLMTNIYNLDMSRARFFKGVNLVHAMDELLSRLRVIRVDCPLFENTSGEIWAPEVYTRLSTHPEIL